ncbi:Putative DNA replication complex GINS protein SLD5 [Septoria linicola]|uniref:DNA replication complex GINS protein SLD5 n=1 Tax=Septoria linicola TaxID=215465 RepID=A0A9Q9AMR9_9PEZI|nr:putative DNA replication complex GINS protein SLD5 [Septoria linicola]USW52327.1 Putative DNA replication complex GINS protein SLD5 [Septoria linicola]
MDDVDISDILASVSAPPIDPRVLDLQALTRAWINERTSPDLLPYPTDLIDRANNGIKRQIETIEDMTGSRDPSKNFTLVILQTELERMKFLVRSYLRARIAKIDTFPIHYRSQFLQTEADDQPLLSTLEAQYLEAHQSLLAQHYHASFLSLFPQGLQRMDDASGGVTMIDRPDEDKAVFCRVLRDCYVERPPYGTVDLARGDIWLLRWSTIADRVKRGDVELV